MDVQMKGEDLRSKVPKREGCEARRSEGSRAEEPRVEERRAEWLKAENAKRERSAKWHGSTMMMRFP